MKCRNCKNAGGKIIVIEPDSCDYLVDVEWSPSRLFDIELGYCSVCGHYIYEVTPRPNTENANKKTLADQIQRLKKKYCIIMRITRYNDMYWFTRKRCGKK